MDFGFGSGFLSFFLLVSASGFGSRVREKKKTRWPERKEFSLISLPVQIVLCEIGLG